MYKTTIMAIGLTLGLGFGPSHAMEQDGVKTDITSQNSTALFYQAAEMGYQGLKEKFSKLPSAHFVESGVSASDALGRIGTAYRHNILECGLHSGIPEGKWSERGGYRGTTKWGNQQLLQSISDFYRAHYAPNTNVTLNDFKGFDGVEIPYITFGQGYEPTVYVSDRDLMEAIKLYKEDYDQKQKQNPNSNGKGENCIIS